MLIVNKKTVTGQFIGVLTGLGERDQNKSTPQMPSATFYIPAGGIKIEYYNSYNNCNSENKIVQRIVYTESYKSETPLNL